MARLKIATFNVNSIRARHDALLAWLEQEQPDIACLQELKATDDAFPADDLERAGYGAVWHGQKSWNGVAILARGAQPVERRRELPDDPDPEQSRYIEAEVHGLVVGCLYLPNGNPQPGPKFDYKLAWMAALAMHARSLLEEGEPVVLAGDYNVVPTDELDIYNPRSWRKDALLQPESREAYAALLEQGWTDALRAVHGDGKIFTFWDFFRRHFERDAGLRIDHLLLGPKLAPLLVDAGVDRWVRAQPGASDHAPAWVVLEHAAAMVGARERPTGPRTTAAVEIPAADEPGDTPLVTPPARKRGTTKRPAKKQPGRKRPARTAPPDTGSRTAAPATPTGDDAPRARVAARPSPAVAEEPLRKVAEAVSDAVGADRGQAPAPAVDAPGRGRKPGTKDT